MRATYRVLAWIIAIEVVVQAAVLAWAVFGLGAWIDGGGVLDKATLESEGASFPEVLGYIVHGINGEIVIPVLSLALLVVGFLAKLPGGVRWAGIVFGLVVVQALLGVFAHGIPALGLLHGIGALAIFMVAMLAVRAAAPATRPTTPVDARV